MRAGVRLLWWLCRGVAALPRWVQYRVLGGFIYIVLRYAMRYRRWLIVRQLRESFPEKSAEQIDALCNRYYRTMAEMVIGTMRLAGMSAEKKRRALQMEVAPEVREMVAGKHFILLASHHHLWEYAKFVTSGFSHLLLCGYHPLKSKTWDELYYLLRRDADTLPIPSNQLIRHFIKHKDEGIDSRPLMIGLIADQNAPPQGDVHWFDFLNHKTLFFEGGEQMAVKFSLPVLYLSMERVAEGEYKGRTTLIYDGNEPIEKHAITERYVRLLEEDIRRAPEWWMWSHRRWKFAPDAEGKPVTVDYSRKKRKK